MEGRDAITGFPDTSIVYPLDAELLPRARAAPDAARFVGPAPAAPQPGAATRAPSPNPRPAR